MTCTLIYGTVAPPPSYKQNLQWKNVLIREVAFLEEENLLVLNLISGQIIGVNFGETGLIREGYCKRWHGSLVFILQ